MRRHRKLPTIALTVALLILTLMQTSLINFGTANPSPYKAFLTVPPPPDADKPEISVTSFTNNSLHNQSNFSLNLTVYAMNPEYEGYLSKVWYQPDWKANNATLYQHAANTNNVYSFSSNLALTDIPEGTHNITFCAASSGAYTEGYVRNLFLTENYLVMCFTVDTVAPHVSILSLDNGSSSRILDIPLVFTVNEATSKVTVDLDGNETDCNATNMTLTGLSVGLHYVTVYAWDTTGNRGISETKYFTIEKPEPKPQPFPTTLLMGASVAIAGVVVCAAVLLYHGRRKETAL